MNALKFAGAQKALVIKQGEEGTPVAKICRKAGISPGELFQLEEKCAGLMPSEMLVARDNTRNRLPGTIWSSTNAL